MKRSIKGIACRKLFRTGVTWISIRKLEAYFCVFWPRVRFASAYRRQYYAVGSHLHRNDGFLRLNQSPRGRMCLVKCVRESYCRDRFSIPNSSIILKRPLRRLEFVVDTVVYLFLEYILSRIKNGI